jgi:hypothetical protein
MKPTKGPITLPLFDAVLRLPSGEVLQLGRFTKKYAVIARNWHCAWLGLDDRPLYQPQEVPDERMDWRGNSLTVWPDSYVRRFNAQRAGRSPRAADVE